MRLIVHCVQRDGFEGIQLQLKSEVFIVSEVYVTRSPTWQLLLKAEVLRSAPSVLLNSGDFVASICISKAAIATFRLESFVRDVLLSCLFRH